LDIKDDKLLSISCSQDKGFVRFSQIFWLGIESLGLKAPLTKPRGWVFDMNKRAFVFDPKGQLSSGVPVLYKKDIISPTLDLSKTIYTVERGDMRLRMESERGPATTLIQVSPIYGELTSYKPSECLFPSWFSGQKMTKEEMIKLNFIISLINTKRDEYYEIDEDKLHENIRSIFGPMLSVFEQHLANYYIDGLKVRRTQAVMPLELFKVHHIIEAVKRMFGEKLKNNISQWAVFGLENTGISGLKDVDLTGELDQDLEPMMFSDIVQNPNADASAVSELTAKLSKLLSEDIQKIKKEQQEEIERLKDSATSEEKTLSEIIIEMADKLDFKPMEIETRLEKFFDIAKNLKGSEVLEQSKRRLVKLSKMMRSDVQSLSDYQKIMRNLFTPSSVSGSITHSTINAFFSAYITDVPDKRSESDVFDIIMTRKYFDLKGYLKTLYMLFDGEQRDKDQKRRLEQMLRREREGLEEAKLDVKKLSLEDALTFSDLRKKKNSIQEDEKDSKQEAELEIKNKVNLKQEEPVVGNVDLTGDLVYISDSEEDNYEDSDD